MSRIFVLPPMLLKKYAISLKCFFISSNSGSRLASLELLRSCFSATSISMFEAFPSKKKQLILLCWIAMESKSTKTKSSDLTEPFFLISPFRLRKVHIYSCVILLASSSVGITISMSSTYRP